MSDEQGDGMAPKYEIHGNVGQVIKADSIGRIDMKITMVGDEMIVESTITDIEGNGE